MRWVCAVLVLALQPAAARPRIAILSTPPDGTETRLFLVAPDATALPAPAARFAHLPSASVQAIVVPESATVVAVADVTPGPDRSFASGLVAIAPGGAPRWLCDGVVEASRPIAVGGGEVLVMRGRAGNSPAAGGYRLDELTLDVVDVANGKLRTVHAMSGYLLYVAGVRGREAVVYRVGFDGADVVAIDLDNGATRPVIASLPPYANDFLIDGDALRFSDRDEVDHRRWVGERVDLTTGVRRADGISAPLPPRLHSADGRWSATQVGEPGELPMVISIERSAGVQRELPHPRGERLTLAGWVP